MPTVVVASLRTDVSATDGAEVSLPSGSTWLFAADHPDSPRSGAKRSWPHCLRS
jgi:hypothetical protein